MDPLPQDNGFHIRRTALVGVGLIGGSLGKALISGGVADEVVGLFRREETMKTALAHGLVHSGTMSVEDAVRDAEVVILATGVESIPELGRSVIPFVCKNALLTDVGSVKGAIVREISSFLADRPDVLFAGSHPLYGSHLQGPAAGASLVPAGRLAVVTPASGRSNADAAALEAEKLWRSIGMRTIRLSPAEHDRLLAFSSHLPHVVAAALARTLPAEADMLASSGFLDTTRIAAGSPRLWSEIMRQNSAGVADALQRLIGDLACFRESLLLQDWDTVAALLESAAAAQARVRERAPRKD
ncbi:MAG: prephenate dehydrogenase [Planctomycetes bacterium]|nr:prephenate dehydrogenase [Planctomycetota bacterium]